MWKRLASWFDDYARYKAAKAVVEQLNRLTDRELKDIGISRGQIREYAYSGSND